MNIKNLTGRCLRGKRGVFTKGKIYQIHWIYQLPDGIFMVEVVDDMKLTVQAYATRFYIDNP